ncbi:MAG: hypothetical protein WDN26_05275 [Chitinophagaceae bacterium]
MNKLELKIIANKSIVEEKLVNKNAATSKNRNKIKSGFSNSWDNGWGNYGKTFKPVEIKF